MGDKTPIFISNQTKIEITDVGRISLLIQKRFGIQIGFCGVV